MESSSESSKRKNFTWYEEEILARLILKYKHNIIERKPLDYTSGKCVGRWAEKKATWDRITEEFNQESKGLYRSVESLKSKYDLMKRKIRSSTSGVNTRGEVVQPELSRLKDMEQRIKNEVLMASADDNSDSVLDENYKTEQFGIGDNSLDSLNSSNDKSNVKTDVADLFDNTQEVEMIQIQPECSYKDDDSSEPPSFDVKVIEEIPIQTESSMHNFSSKVLNNGKNKSLFNVLSDKTHDDLTKAKMEVLRLKKYFYQTRIKAAKLEAQNEERKRKREEELFQLEKQKMQLKIKLLQEEVKKIS